MLEILHEENPSVPNPPIVVYLLEILHEENPPVPNPPIAIYLLEILREENYIKSPKYRPDLRRILSIIYKLKSFG